MIIIKTPPPPTKNLSLKFSIEITIFDYKKHIDYVSYLIIEQKVAYL